MSKRDAKRQAILDTARRLYLSQGFDKTSVSQITAEVGGSKATIYSHFPSKEELFVECMTAAVDGCIAQIASTFAEELDSVDIDPASSLRGYGAAYLELVCSPSIVATRRLLIAEATRSGIGKLLLARIAEMRTHVVALISRLMVTGVLRPDDAALAAEQLRALLEAEVLEPLLLHMREKSPDQQEMLLAADRAVSAFLRAYAPTEP
jgi:AcrR family transcriptional regulator